MAFAGLVRAVGASVQAIGGWGSTSLADALEKNEDRTKRVDLECNRLGSDGFRRVFRALAHNSSCEGLRLGWAGVGDDDAGCLAEALRTNQSLQFLGLSENPIGDAGFRSICEALASNEQSALEELWLASTNVTGESEGCAEALASALLINKSITKLQLERCPISDAGAQKLRDAASHSRTLKTLNISGFNVLERAFAGGSSGPSSAAVREVNAALRRLTDANFVRAYGKVEAFDDLEDLVSGIDCILRGVAAKQGIPPNDQRDLTKALKQLIQRKSRAMVHLGAAAAWTSADKMPMSDGWTFYGSIQAILREDKSGEVLDNAARFCRTFNKFLVGPRDRAGRTGLATGNGARSSGCGEMGERGEVKDWCPGWLQRGGWDGPRICFEARGKEVAGCSTAAAPRLEAEAIKLSHVALVLPIGPQRGGVP